MPGPLQLEDMKEGWRIAASRNPVRRAMSHAETIKLQDVGWACGIPVTEGEAVPSLSRREEPNPLQKSMCSRKATHFESDSTSDAELQQTFQIDGIRGR